MNRGRILTAVLFAGCLCGRSVPLSRGNEATDVVAALPADATDSAIPDLLRELASDSFLTREWAASQLGACGPPGVIALRDAAREADASRAREIIATLQRLASHGGRSVLREAFDALHSLRDDEMLTRELRDAADDALRQAVRVSTARLRALDAVVLRDHEGSIREVRINSRQFSDEHLQQLLLPSIESLDLRNSGITDDSLADLAKLTSLTSLNISDTAVTGAAIRELAPLTNLERLAVYRIALDADELEWLSAHLPRCRVHR